MIKHLNKILILLIFVVGNINSLCAQNIDNAGIAKINKSVNTCIFKYYKADSVSVNNVCEKGFFLMKFKIDSTNLVSALSFSEKAPQFIQQALSKAIRNIESDLFLTNMMKRSGKTFLLPVMYQYQLGCSFNKDPQFSGGDNYYKKYLATLSDMDKFPASILSMLNFADGRMMGLDAVVLSPITVGALGY